MNGTCDMGHNTTAPWCSLGSRGSVEERKVQANVHVHRQRDMCNSWQQQQQQQQHRESAKGCDALHGEQTTACCPGRAPQCVLVCPCCRCCCRQVMFEGVQVHYVNYFCPNTSRTATASAARLAPQRHSAARLAPQRHDHAVAWSGESRRPHWTL
jgi:hypothetical protein